MENRERGIGWPLGLGSMYMRLRLMECLAVGGASSDTRSPIYFHSSSFSSFTSSNFDTESTASFFQDNSKTLGRLIGIRPPHTNNTRRSEFYTTNSVVNDRSETQHHTNSVVNDRSETQHHTNSIVNETQHQLMHNTTSKHGNEIDMEMCDGLCLPLCLVAKISKNKQGYKR